MFVEFCKEKYEDIEDIYKAALKENEVKVYSHMMIEK